MLYKIVGPGKGGYYHRKVVPQDEENRTRYNLYRPGGRASIYDNTVVP